MALDHYHQPLISLNCPSQPPNIKKSKKKNCCKTIIVILLLYYRYLFLYILFSDLVFTWWAHLLSNTTLCTMISFFTPSTTVLSLKKFLEVVIRVLHALPNIVQPVKIACNARPSIFQFLYQRHIFSWNTSTF